MGSQNYSLKTLSGACIIGGENRKSNLHGAQARGLLPGLLVLLKTTSIDDCKTNKRDDKRKLANDGEAHSIFLNADTSHRGVTHRLQKFGSADRDWEGVSNRSIQTAQQCDSRRRRFGGRRISANAELFSGYLAGVALWHFD